jgi:glucose/arabinose dehydrogenase
LPPAPTSDTAALAAATAAAAPLRPLAVERAFPNLTFRHLTNLAQPDDGLDRIFVTEQEGRILTFANRQQVAAPVLFLDLSSRVSEAGDEEGLLGLAFDPDYRRNGYLYVYYSAANPRRSILSRFSAGPDGQGTADLEGELVIMEIPQPYSNHNGGQLAFGPEGYLYVGLGDGGGAGDPHGNGQNKATLLGSILRIDVAGSSQQERYRIPADNPFVGVSGARQEIWAYGFRNPWRFSFDPPGAGRMWAADVGQNSWEEINLVEKGLNYGWNVMEGAHCFSPRSGCEGAGLQPPVAEYSSAEGCSVIGGYVYRGARLPSLAGAYIYGDFCSGKIWGFRYDGGLREGPTLLAAPGLFITSFGLDLAGDLYILSRDSGIYRLAPAE